ncbi:oxygenase MpaB family protein [Rhodococcus sp. NPDC003318]|uniref:oxygenase MpaB family protein n=1 Tax=Rhodococcus sp. NPDC003318 TaxID=3364503 RepID=UPI00367C61F9
MSGNILTDSRLATTLRRVDHGFFGPDSVSWRVWSHPAILIGLQRAVAMQFLNPFFAAAQDDARSIYRQPAHFFDITLSFLLSGILGDSRTALTTSDFITAIHTHATGIEPVTQKRYNANSPEAQLYTHVDGWQSMLKCYELLGPGPLDPDSELRYWHECSIAAELFTCKASDVPRSRDEVRRYYASLRPRLCLSERARSGLRQQLYTSGPYTEAKIAAISRIGAPVSVATMPKWVRTLAGIDQPAVVDRAAVAGMRTLLTAVARSHRATWTLIGIAAPIAGGIVREHFRAEPPEQSTVTTPDAARIRFGRTTTRHQQPTASTAPAAAVAAETDGSGRP